MILDIGCGENKIVNTIGIDKFDSINVDVVHDLDLLPWPFEDEQFEKLIFSHSISHLEDISAIICECYRILKPGGLIEIVAPHYSSDNFNTDPTHKMSLGLRSMNYFVYNVQFKYTYIPSHIKFKLLSNKISFRECNTSWRKGLKFNFFEIIGLQWIVNKFPRLYERQICWIFPASEVYFLMKKMD